jgi:uncharacterized protein YkwD
MKKVKSVLRHLFVPGHHNNHHSGALSHFALTAYLVVMVASFVTLRNISMQTNNVLGFATDISPSRVIELTNNQRQSSGLSTLTYNNQLAVAAAAKAQDMIAKGYWAHFGPSGETPWGFILSSGYQYEYAGENLAKNFMDSGSVVNAWMASETHRANILNNNYKEIGVAILNGNLSGEDTTLVVQMFGSKSQIAGENTNSIQPELTTAPIEQVTMIPVRGRTLPTQSQKPKTNLQAVIPSTTPVLTERISLTPVTNSPQENTSPYINLLPAFRLISAIAIGFLIVIFAIDLYHISRTQFHKHRGKHMAHIIFLIAILIGIYFLGRGAIL